MLFIRTRLSPRVKQPELKADHSLHLVMRCYTWFAFMACAATPTHILYHRHLQNCNAINALTRSHLWPAQQKKFPTSALTRIKVLGLFVLQKYFLIFYTARQAFFSMIAKASCAYRLAIVTAAISCQLTAHTHTHTHTREHSPFIRNDTVATPTPPSTHTSNATLEWTFLRCRIHMTLFSNSLRWNRKGPSQEFSWFL